MSHAQQASLKIAQPFMAGFTVRQSSQSRQGRKKLSSVPDGTRFLGAFSPAMNGWAIFKSVQTLAELDKWQFQQWALSLIDARPRTEGDGKGADRGVDGMLYFYDLVGTDSTPAQTSGKTKSGD